MSGSGDHVDEAVEDDSGGGSSLHALKESILLLGGGIGVLHRIHCVGSVNLDGADQVLFIPSHAIGGGDSVVIRLPRCESRVHLIVVAEVVVGVAFELRRSPVGEEEVDDLGTSAILKHLREQVGGILLVDTGSDAVTLDLQRTVVRNVHPVTATVREENAVHNLDIVVLLKGRNDVDGSKNRFVERSTTETELASHGRQRVAGVPTLRLGEGVALRHSSVEFSLVHAAGEEIEQGETVLTAFPCSVIRLLGTILIEFVRHGTGEGIHFERNVNLLAEENQLHYLFHRFDNLVAHATRPIEEHNQTVVLTIADGGSLAENILGPLVVHHLHGIERTSLGNLHPLVCICLLLHLELLRQHVNRGLGSDDELAAFSIARFLRCIHQQRTTEKTMKTLVVDDMTFEVNPLQRFLAAIIRCAASVSHSVGNLRECLFSDRLRYACTLSASILVGCIVARSIGRGISIGTVFGVVVSG